MRFPFLSNHPGPQGENNWAALTVRKGQRVREREKIKGKDVRALSTSLLFLLPDARSVSPGWSIPSPTIIMLTLALFSLLAVGVGHVRAHACKPIPPASAKICRILTRRSNLPPEHVRIQRHRPNVRLRQPTGRSPRRLHFQPMVVPRPSRSPAQSGRLLRAPGRETCHDRDRV